MPFALGPYLEAWRSGDVDGVLEAYADDVVVTSPLSDDPLRGKEACRGLVAALLAAFDEVEMEVEPPLAEAEGWIAGRLRVRGRFAHPLVLPGGRTLEATGRAFDLVAAGFASIGPDGRVHEETFLFDAAEAARQLALPADVLAAR